MQITYLNPYHVINQELLGDKPSLVKVGVVGTGDLDRFKELYPKGDVIAYEADPDNFNKYNTGKYKFHQKAVGNGGYMEFYKYSNIVSHSTFPRHLKDANCRLVDTITVKSVSLEDILKDNNLNYLDVLILNCEGGELSIMESLKDKKVRDKIGQICVSFHDPRIYPTAKKEKIFDELGQYYEIERGGGASIPDYLMCRRTE